MKCELCHKADAQVAITVGEGEGDELYVCSACAKQERQKQQRKSQRTRKVTGLPPGMEMSVTEFSTAEDEDSDDDGHTPVIGAIVNAFSHIVSGLEKVQKQIADGEAAEKGKKDNPASNRRLLPVGRIAAAYRIRKRYHLEGLFLIGELSAVQRAVKALGMELVGISADGTENAGHAFNLAYVGSDAARAERLAEDILKAERIARKHLVSEMPRVFADSLARALAILKNARLLSGGELFDLLSPVRLAAQLGYLDGITAKEVDAYMMGADLSDSDEKLMPEERDQVDAARADEINMRFEDVMMNEKAEREIL